LACPDADWAFPTVQGEQAVDSVVFEKRPWSQSLHSLEPSALLNFPTTHFEHDSAEAPEYEPTVQTWQVSADWLKARNFPGSQAVQDVAPKVRSVLDPTAQDRQASTSEVGA